MAETQTKVQISKSKGMLSSQNMRKTSKLTDSMNDPQANRTKSLRDMINDNKQSKDNMNNFNNPAQEFSSKSVNSYEENLPTVKPKQFEFKLGLQVGAALGECHLQLQNLDNSMLQLSTVSEKIQDVVLYLKDSIGTTVNNNFNKTVIDDNKGDTDDTYKQSDMNILNDDSLFLSPRNHRINNVGKLGKSPDSAQQSSILSPFDEILELNNHIEKWKQDTNKRRQDLTNSIHALQTKLEELDNFSESKRSVTSIDRTDLDEAYKKIAQLQGELQKAKIDLSNTTLKMTQLRNDLTDKEKQLEEKTKKFEEREKTLDRDAEIIAAQSDALRKESERLLKERDDVKKQKEQWQQMLDEQKEHKSKLEEQVNEFQINQRKLLALQTHIEEEKQRIAKRKKKLKSREKRVNLLRNQSSFGSNGHNNNNANSNSDAQSELTYFSDGDTEIASVNSISDDENDNNNISKTTNSKSQAISHLAIPQNSFE